MVDEEEAVKYSSRASGAEIGKAWLLRSNMILTIVFALCLMNLTVGIETHTPILTIKVIRDKRTGKTKGYGFVSFSNPADLAAALKEMNGKYVGNRPIKLRKSSWKERTDQEAAERQKHHSNKKQKTVKKSILHK